ncbi:MAG TPA: hypothetical protein VN654_00095 [Vicinamibacterales bacterium]|jgi:hypothetical protein|nr:hypothetical protein [Vicinamibacterales bacterium]
MPPLREWSFARVALVSSAWMAVCVLAVVAYLLYRFRGLFLPSSGSGGFGFVSFGFNLLTLAIPLLPPIVLIAAWLIARRSSTA